MSEGKEVELKDKDIEEIKKEEFLLVSEVWGTHACYKESAKKVYRLVFPAQDTTLEELKEAVSFFNEKIDLTIKDRDAKREAEAKKDSSAKVE